MGNFLNRKKRKQGFVAPPESEMKEDDMVEIINKLENRKRGQTEKDNYVEFISPRSEFSGKHCAKKIKKSRKHFVPGEEKEKCESYPGNGLAGSSKKEQHLKCFLDLFDDEVIQDFMWNDGCAKLIDKYLLAMVYVYFRRADLPTRSYSRLNFFAALFLAHDMEEDDEEIKQEIFPWALGCRWKTTYRSLIKRRDDLLQRMNFRSLVSNITCLEVFELCPTHPLWQRERQFHHGGATRLYPPEDEMPYDPKGPGRSPTFCAECTLQIYDEIVMQEQRSTSQMRSQLSKSSNSCMSHDVQADNVLDPNVFGREE